MFWSPEVFRASPVMYRDHQKGPGVHQVGPSAPEGCVGQVWEGTIPRWAGAPPLGPPLRLGLGTLGEGAPPLALGGTPPPLAAAPPRDPISRAGYPPGGLYKGGGREGSRTPESWRLPPLLHLFLLPLLLGEALPESCCIHHHAVVLLDLHQPLLPPCWIKKEETSR